MTVTEEKVKEEEEDNVLLLLLVVMMMMIMMLMMIMNEGILSKCSAEFLHMILKLTNNVVL